jgi:hypothetical protein
MADFYTRNERAERFERLALDFVNSLPDWAAVPDGVQTMGAGEGEAEQWCYALAELRGHPHADAFRYRADIAVVNPEVRAVGCMEIKSATRVGPNYSVEWHSFEHSIVSYGLEHDGLTSALAKHPPLLFVFGVEGLPVREWRCCPAGYLDKFIVGEGPRPGSSNGSGKRYALYRWHEMPRLGETLADVLCYWPGVCQGVIGAAAGRAGAERS